MNHFTQADAVGILVGCLLFAVFSLLPGYLVGYWLNAWDFRRRTFAFQLVASVCLSLSVGPIFTFLLGSMAGWNVVWVAYIAAAIAGLWLCVRSRPKLDSTVWKACAAGLAWAFFAGAWLMDWQFGARVYFPIYGFDYSTRAAFVHSLAVFGLPAQNPLFNPGHPVYLHYHFVWFLQCALVHWVAPLLVTARLAIIAGAIWCGVGLMAATALAMRLWMGRCSWLAIGLLTITGVDILLLAAGQPANSLHLMAMLHTGFGEPHYVCALVACVTGLLVVSESPLVAGLCFATAVGAGSFVALVFAVFLAVWVILNWRTSRQLVFAGLLTVLFSWPYLQSLRGPSQNVAGEPLLSLTLLTFSSLPPTPWQNLLELPVNYFLEFGLFGVCAAMAWRRKRMLALMAGLSVLICTFVKSGATPNNDLGWRGLLVAQFALLLLTAAWMERPAHSNWIRALIALGLLGTAYDLPLNRLFPILSDMHSGQKPAWMASDERLGHRTAGNRQAYEWLQRHSNATATIAQNPDVESVDIFSGLYADRRIVAGDRTCTIGFGGTAAECAPLETLLTDIFAGRRDFESACSSIPAEFYTVKDTDPVWKQAGSWNWTRRPVFANEFVRIFQCGQSKLGNTMNLDHYKELLLRRRDELLDDVRRYDGNVLDAQVAEVGDTVDMSVTDLAKSEAADLSSTAQGELGLVEDALKRIEAGTYGKCIECGETIPEARLEAVPWAPYCVKDQEARERGMASPATL